MNRDPNVLRLGARAVDVGYYNVKFTLGLGGNGDQKAIATDMFPALAPRLAEGERDHGPSAGKLDGCTVEVDGATYFVGKDVEHNASGTEPRPVSEEYSLTAKYLALLRGALHYIAVATEAPEVIITHLVVGLPLHTYSRYRGPLAKRATGEHWLGTASCGRRVTVENVHVIPQPQGALFNFAKGSALDGVALVVDPGGGTLDWFVASKEKPNYPRSGAYPKAMLACSYAVADAIDPRWRDQYGVIRETLI